jgi:chemotaxis protein methyltransferase CheR
LTGGINAVPMSRLAGIVENLIGLHFPRERLSDLERGIASTAKELGFKGPGGIVDGLLSGSLSERQLEALTANLTIGETYFNREKAQLDALEFEILPEIIRKKGCSDRTLRIWSAGCATGEEPYSIAAILNRFSQELADWKITLLATDINSRSIKTGMAAEYGEWSFRGNPQWFKEKYFIPGGTKRLRLNQQIKEMVTFQYLNLIEDTYPSLHNNTAAMDVIFCRNVLIYFSEATRKSLTGKFFRSLVEGGWLIVSSTETSALFSSEFRTYSLSGTTIYKKEAGGSARPPAPLTPGVFQPPWMQNVFMTPWETPDQKEVPKPPAPVKKPLRAPPEIARKPAPIRDGMAEAERLFAEGRYEEAIGILKDILKREPKNVKAITVMARSAANLGRLKDALDLCEGAVAVDVLNPLTHYLRAMILQEQGRIDDARDALRKVMYLDDKFVLAHFAFGNLAASQGRSKEADRHLGNALKLLRNLKEDEAIPESDGITAGRFIQIICSTMSREGA